MDVDSLSDDKHQISLLISHGQGQLWNARDVHFSWTSCRIVGCLVGSLPRHPHQSAMMGLPLKLMPEEVTLLLEKDFAKPVTYQEVLKEPSSAIKNIFDESKKKCYEEQIAAAIECRKLEIEQVADIILQGKRKKFEERKAANSSSSEHPETFEITREKIIEEEMKKIQKLPEHLQVMEIFTENPMVEMLKPTPVEWSFPSSKRDKLRYAVFRDLWERNYFLTTGVKFGGDYLAYPGDPHLFHAKFIVKCVESLETVDQCDLVSWSRIGTATKKTLVLASLDHGGQVCYQSFQLLEDEFS